MKKLFMLVLIVGSFSAFSQQTKKETKETRIIINKSDDGKEFETKEDRQITVIMDDEKSGKIIEKRIVNGDTVSVNIRELPAGGPMRILRGGEDSPRVMIFKDKEMEDVEEFSWNDEEGNHFKFRGERPMRGDFPKIRKEFRELMEKHHGKMGEGFPPMMRGMESETIEGLMVHPNSPNDGKLNVQFHTEEKGNVVIAVMDINGKELSKSEIKDFEGHYFGQINVKSTDKGVYFVRVIQNGDGLIRRIKIN